MKDAFKCLWNGEIELDVTDEEPLLQGTIAFQSEQGTEVLIDDIEVYLLTEPLRVPLPRSPVSPESPKDWARG